MSNETTALIPVAGAALPVIPPMMSNVSMDDMRRPQLKLIQGISPEVTELGVKAGQLFASVLNIELGSEVLVTVLGYKKELVLWNPQRNADPMILARSTDCVTWDEDAANKEFTVMIPNVGKVLWKTGANVADSGLNLFGSSVPTNKDSKPALTETHNYLMYIHGEDMLPVVLSLARSQIKTAAKGLNTICFGSSADPRSFKIKLRVTSRTKDGQDFYGLVPMRGGKLDQDQYMEMVRLSTAFKDFTTTPERDDDEGHSGPSRRTTPVDFNNVEY